MQKIIRIIFITLILINISYVFAGVVFHPLQSMDSIGIWFFKAKAFHLEHGFPSQFLHNPEYNYSHQQYPLGLPFFISLFWNFNEKLILLIYPLTYSVIIFLVYSVLRRKTNGNTSLIFTYIYSMLSPLIAGGGRILAGNADIFLVLIGWLILFTIYKKSLKTWNYLLITILIMLATQIKLEGVFFSIFTLWLPVVKKQKYLLFTISLVPFFLWLITIHTLHIPSDTHLIMPNSGLFLQRLVSIGRGVIQELVNLNNWYILWPIIGLLLFTKSKISTQLKTILLPSYSIIMTLYLSIYLFASNDVYTYITSSFDRILLQQSPIVFLFFFEKLEAIIKSFPIFQSSDKHPSK
jgi:hypothetical protein